MQEVCDRRKTTDFHQALSRYDLGEMVEAGRLGAIAISAYCRSVSRLGSR
ncbi:hypothetical protein [Egbenema bharatensis]